ncbi:sodium channel regulatory subunit beta-1 isoform X2 [Athene noctua]|uniref:sodium channel regulatory subunit beta-1 isoform X2 n=1 Tax=Athene noctua TaxID=126797 RepID=UPI003EBCF43A
MLGPGLALLCGLLMAGGAQGGCVEVASGTEAVLGAPFRLLCIACKRRSETTAEAESEWFFRPEGDPHFQKILHYSPEEGQWVAPGPFAGVLAWNGSRGTRDLQDLSVRLAAVGRPHAGHYVCRLRRNLTFEGYVYSLARNKTLRLAVVDTGRLPTDDLTDDVTDDVTADGRHHHLHHLAPPRHRHPGGAPRGRGAPAPKMLLLAPKNGVATETQGLTPQNAPFFQPKITFLAPK